MSICTRESPSHYEGPSRGGRLHEPFAPTGMMPRTRKARKGEEESPRFQADASCLFALESSEESPQIRSKCSGEPPNIIGGGSRRSLCAEEFTYFNRQDVKGILTTFLHYYIASPCPREEKGKRGGENGTSDRRIQHHVLLREPGKGHPLQQRLQWADRGKGA